MRSRVNLSGVDDELRRELRDFAALPSDPGAIRLAAAFERLHRFKAAWQLLARRLDQGGDDQAILAALGGLAARNRVAAVHFLRREGVDEARFSCLALARAGELFPLVVLASEAPEEPRVIDAGIALRRALQGRIEGLPGPHAFGVYLAGEDRTRGLVDVVYAQTRLIQRYGPDEMLRELGFLAHETERGPNRGPTFARELLARVRVERSLALLPWVSAMRGARDTALASDAVALFQELTGRLAPPLDPEDLARRWT
ncbi:MAG TPA: hypothetical protein VFF73_26175 [Planctomycetota bacterium]|nr:hypothetical protein [Planctomycetota bacterium]